ncbi:MAG: hypothetical protein ABIS06_11790 [Vicinamibacterales bacterium]
MQDGAAVAGRTPFTDMDLRDFARTETDAFIDRLMSHADEAAGNARTHADHEIAAVRAQADGLQSELEVEAARAAALEADLDTVIEAHRQVEAERDAAEARIASLKSELEAATSLMNEVTSEADARVTSAREEFEKDAASLQAELAALQMQLARQQSEIGTLQAERASAAGQLQTTAEKLDAAQRDNTEQSGTIRQLQKRLTQSETAVAATLASSVRAIEALDSAANTNDLFATMVKQLGMELPRVAVFRVKGNHLVGEHGAGLDANIDLSKLMIPMSVDSIITRAVAHGGLVRAEGEQLADTRAPFGGTPACALAVPVIFQDETFAVLYADFNVPASQAHATSMVLLARYAGALLSRLMQELKSLKELRDYAAVLLQEAELMFASDTAAGRPAPECTSRLRETIDCGRQIFSQRASLEGPAAIGLLDELIAAVTSAQATPFAGALKAALEIREKAERTAS